MKEEDLKNSLQGLCLTVCLVIGILLGGCFFSSTQRQIENAVRSGDDGAIIRAFHAALYDRSSDMDEVRPALRHFLDNQSPSVRLRAAEALYITGDRSGYPILIALVRSPNLQMHVDQDLRIKAARILAKFRERPAAADIFDLYLRTQKRSLLVAAQTVGSTEALPAIAQLGYIENKFSIERYGSFGLSGFIPKLRVTFSSTTEPDIRNAAAYALARLTGEQSYVEHLIQAAQPAINTQPRSGEFTYDDSSNALKYLGSIQSPLASETLARALDSYNGVVVQYAAVNLLLNQPVDSAKARQVIVQQLNDKTLRFDSWERVFQLAAQLDDPLIKQAGEHFDRSATTKSWRLWGVKRRTWSNYTWIDDYVQDYQNDQR